MNVNARLVENFDLESGEPPGTVAIDADGRSLLFSCPCGCGAVGHLDLEPGRGRPTWSWNGSRTAPTLTPSILQLECRWHGWLRNGEWVPA